MKPFRTLTSFVLIGLLSSVFFAGVAQALILDSQEELVFDQYVTEDVYLAGGNVTIQQDIDGDLFVAGGTVTVNGTIDGDLLIGGGSVLVNGNVTDDVRIIGGSLAIDGSIQGDLIVIGGDLDLNQSASVEGDVVLIAGNANLYGTINRSVQGILGRLVIGGQINGNVDVRVTEKLVLLNSGNVAGDVTYFAPQKIEDHGGTISGNTSFNEIISSTSRLKESLRSLLNRGQLVGALWSYFSLLLIGGLLISFLPNFFDRTSLEIRKEGLKSFGVGFLVFILVGIAAVIAVFTIIGVQLAFIAMAMLFVLGEMGRIAAGYWIGGLLIKDDAKKRATSSKRSFFRHFGVLALGLLILKLLTMIPYIGWTAGFVFFLTGAGAIFLVQRTTYRHLVKEKML
ncbi:MAG: polymer-forming cytoskeletal protein [Candidatus Peregrinibacteria bacterium]|nr:polymer-forming cytoskeletal protein [Candidatus Peregrinibacteria bacterium]